MCPGPSRTWSATQGARESAGVWGGRGRRVEGGLPPAAQLLLARPCPAAEAPPLPAGQPRAQLPPTLGTSQSRAPHAGAGRKTGASCEGCGHLAEFQGFWSCPGACARSLCGSSSSTFPAFSASQRRPWGGCVCLTSTQGQSSWRGCEGGRTPLACGTSAGRWPRQPRSVHTLRATLVAQVAVPEQ